VLIAGALLEPVLATVVGGGASATTSATVGPAALAVILVGAARFGVWQGPVGFSVADVCLVLLAPVDRAALVRPKLGHALAVAALAGGLLGLAAVLLSAGGLGAVGAARTVATVAAIAGFGALAAAVGWLVQSTPALARGVSAGGSLLVVAAGLPLLGVLGATARTFVGWSGPWGWAIAPWEGLGGWPVATGLVVVTALVAVGVARRRTAEARVEEFLGRAQVRAGMASAAFTLDYRGAALARRGGVGPTQRSRGVGARMARALRRPRWGRAALVWRDARSLVRAPSRAGWAALVAAAGIVETVTHPGRGLPAGVAAIALYGAAALLCEPLRSEVDQPDRGRVLLSWPFPRVLLGHCVVPAVVLLVTGLAALGGLVLAGSLAPAGLVLAPTLVAAGIGVAVLCASLATRRGGRIGPELLARLLALDPSSPMVLLGVVWLAPWLLVCTIVLTLVAALAGHASGAPGTVESMTVLAGIVGVVLFGVARRSPAPGD
jgi:hypothetical protein